MPMTVINVLLPINEITLRLSAPSNALLTLMEPRLCQSPSTP